MGTRTPSVTVLLLGNCVLQIALCFCTGIGTTGMRSNEDKKGMTSPHRDSVKSLPRPGHLRMRCKNTKNERQRKKGPTCERTQVKAVSRMRIG